VYRPDKKLRQLARCVHCLRELDTETKDHVFPASWYPDNTPADVQRWTVPSCADCNGKLGKLEKELFVRLSLCVDPRKAEASGMSKKALKSFGIGVADLNAREKQHREGLLRKVFTEAKPLRHQEIPLLPGAGPHAASPAGDQMTITIPGGVLEDVAEKIVRGCEFKLNSGAYIEQPMKVKIYFVHDERAEDLTAFLDRLPATTVGPGFHVTRGQAPPAEGVHIVLYRIVIWGTWKIYAAVDADEH
jgi:hypothetical protein